MDEKRALRKRMKALRESMGPDARGAADARIAERVCANPAYASAQSVFTYLSVGDEVDTRAIIQDAWSRGKLVAIPRVVPGTRNMEWYAIDSFDGMEKSKLGVEEPVADAARLVPVPAEPGSASVALVPGFTFDAQGYRLGYGGGFYDTFLPTFGGVSLGLCREAQYDSEPIPRDEHDCAVDEVVIG